MNNNETFKIKAFITYLKGVGRITSQSDFGAKMDYNNPSSLSTAINNPTADFIANIEKTYPEFKGFNQYTSNVREKKFNNFTEVRLVTTKARAGYSDSFYSQEYLKDMPIVLIESDKEYKGNYLAFEVENDSMEPEYYEGDILICREIKRELWQYKLHYKDYDFVIAHSTKGIFFKEISNHYVETGEITCHSLNNKYDDFSLNLREVTYLYNVVEVRSQGKNKRNRR